MDRLLKIRQQTVDFVKDTPRLELISEPDYLNICVRVVDPNGADSNWSKVVRTKLIDSDVVMVNYSTNKDGPFLRLILSHPQLEFSHVQKILQAALDITT